VVPAAASPITAAAMARTVSTVLTAGRAATGPGAARGAAGAERGAAGAAAVARGALGVRAGAALGPAAGAAAAGAPVGPPGGSVGSLMVGAAEGLGGKLIRTVSFLGWTFPVSFLGGTAPLGTLGRFSAIKSILLQARVAARECQTLIPSPNPAAGTSQAPIAVPARGTACPTWRTLRRAKYRCQARASSALRRSPV
jgi:hypothetical protein